MTTLLNLDPSQVPDDGNGLVYDAASKKWLPGKIASSSAFAPLADALNLGADTALLVIGDSTGNGTDEWVYLTGQWIAQRFPEYTVEHRLWDDAAKKYSRPTYIQTGPAGVQYAQLADTSGTCLQQDQTFPLTAGGDLDLRVKLAADDWTPSTTGAILACFQGAGQRVFRLQLTTLGWLAFDWTADGSTIQPAATSPATGLTDGSVAWVRVTLDVDNGAGQHEIKFYTSTDDGATWTQLGSTITRAGTTGVFAGSNSQWEAGGRGGSAERLAGKWYEVEIRNGIGDAFPLLAAPMANAWRRSSSTTPLIRAGSPLMTFINGAISGGGLSNFASQAPAMVPPWLYSLGIISTGHNEALVGASFKTAYLGLVEQVTDRTLTAVALCSQNPKTAPQTQYNIDMHAQRFADLGTLSAYLGSGYLNIYQAFTDDPRPMSDLVSVDGIHPTAAGSQLWAGIVTDAIAAAL